MIDPVLRDAESKMGKSVEHFATELSTIRTGRANPALIDKVMVPYYGTPTPLKELAQISAPEPRLLTVTPWDKGLVQAIEKALRDELAQMLIRGDKRLLGTDVAGLFAAGTFYYHGELVFWDVADTTKTIIVSLEHERYKKLIERVDQVEREMRQIEHRVGVPLKELKALLREGQLAEFSEGYMW